MDSTWSTMDWPEFMEFCKRLEGLLLQLEGVFSIIRSCHRIVVPA